jgi:hypothetical protein
MSFTYGQLKQAIQDYTQNDEATFVANLPLFIRAAEERILKTVQLSLFRKNATATLSTGSKYLAMPTDYLAPFSFAYYAPGVNREFALFKSPNFVQEVYPDDAVIGPPRYYTVFDNSNFLVAPVANQDFTIELHYLYRPASLTAGSDSGTTWLSENAELSMLYGALIEAYIFMKGEQDLVAYYNQRFNESMTGLKLLGEAKETTDHYRTGEVVRPKQ